jgi:hypothetical protein
MISIQQISTGRNPRKLKDFITYIHRKWRLIAGPQRELGLRGSDISNQHIEQIGA